MCFTHQLKVKHFNISTIWCAIKNLIKIDVNHVTGVPHERLMCPSAPTSNNLPVISFKYVGLLLYMCLHNTWHSDIVSVSSKSWAACHGASRWSGFKTASSQAHSNKEISSKRSWRRWQKTRGYQRRRRRRSFESSWSNFSWNLLQCLCHSHCWVQNQNQCGCC